MARASGISDHRDASRGFATRAAAGIAPIDVTARDAPVQQTRHPGNEIDLRRLPALRQHVYDVGHYITAGHCTTIEPDSDADNTSVQRCWVKGSRLLSFFPYSGSHNARNVAEFWARGQPCPVAVWIGHHPAVVSAVRRSSPIRKITGLRPAASPVSAVRLVPTLTHGARLKVPADAEIVIEKIIPRNRLEAEAPSQSTPAMSASRSPRR